MSWEGRSEHLTDTAPAVRPAVATACGKVILLGEHAVVYGEPALAVPMHGLRLSVVLGDGAPLGRQGDSPAAVEGTTDGTATMGAAMAVRRNDGSGPDAGPGTLDGEGVPPLAFDVEAGAPEGARDGVARALGTAARALRLPVPLPLRVAVRSGGLASGLGTSAALGVAMVRALCRWYGEEPSQERLLDAAMAVETLFHGNPSGVDVAVSAMERPLWFSKGETPLALEGLPPLRLVLLRRRSPHTTRALVEGVRARLAAEPSLARTIAELGRQSRDGRAAWERHDPPGLAAAMNAQQQGLDRLGVVHDVDREGVRTALAAGALAAKITGAGGGGTLIALVEPDREEAVVLAWGDGVVGGTVGSAEAEPG